MAMQEEDTLGLITKALETFKGKPGSTTTSSGSTTSTTKSDISKDGVASILQQLLSSNQGLAAVASGQKSAGLYNSTVNQQMVNDLLTRTSGQVAQMQAGTTQTVTPNTVVKTTNAPQIKTSEAAKVLGALQAVSAAKGLYGNVAAGAKKLGINSFDDLTKKVYSTLGMDSGSVDTGGGGMPSLNNSMSLGVNSSSPGFTDQSVGVSNAGSADEFSQSLNSILGSSGSTESNNSSVDLSSVGNVSVGADQSFSDTPSLSNTMSLGSNTDSSSLKLSDEDLSNFSGASDSSATTSASANSYSGSNVNYLKIAQFADKPDKLKNDLSFNDKSVQEKIKGVADVVSVAYPLAGFVGGAIDSTDANADDTMQLFRNPLHETYLMSRGKDDLGQMVQRDISNVGATISETADSIGRAGETVGNAVGDVFQGVGNGIGSGLSSVAESTGWIICTELLAQQRMPKMFYKYGARVFKEYKDEHKKGYYIWAIPTVKHLRKFPDSLYSRTICSIFNWRAEYIAAAAGCKQAKKSFKGYIVTALTFYLCVGLSKVVPEQDWKVLYAKH